jgi:hypothetical protein
MLVWERKPWPCLQRGCGQALVDGFGTAAGAAQAGGRLALTAPMREHEAVAMRQEEQEEGTF